MGTSREKSDPSRHLGATSAHSIFVVLVFGPVPFGASTLIASAAGLEWKTAFPVDFALSFSSTVFAVKTLTENGDLAVLAMPTHSANLHAIETLKRHDFQGVFAASAKYPYEIKELRKLGAYTAFNLYSQAENKFANHVIQVSDSSGLALACSWEKEEE